MRVVFILLLFLKFINHIVIGKAIGIGNCHELPADFLHFVLLFLFRQDSLALVDKGARTLVCLQNILDFEFFIGLGNRVQVHLELHRERPYGRQLLARSDRPGGDAGQDLVDDLAVERDAARTVEAKRDWHRSHPL